MLFVEKKKELIDGFTRSASFDSNIIHSAYRLQLFVCHVLFSLKKKKKEETKEIYYKVNFKS